MEINKKKFNNIIKISKKIGKCPICKKKSIEPYSPFCSKSCSDKDLIKWLSDESSININT
tara:strand:- start:109 stop:288 length:180 start_codon:yes stop_codon:yes gene_type:complete